MGEGDRERWDARYREGSHRDLDAPAWLGELGLPHAGRALDVAAGAGRVALWLAARGLDTLAIDVSPVGLEIAARRAAESGLRLQTRALDLESEPPPDGPFDVITCFHYLQRDLFPRLIERLAPGGWLCCEIATERNLERHARPSRRFLLAQGELLELCTGLEVVHAGEDWHDDRHVARVAARSATTPR